MALQGLDRATAPAPDMAKRMLDQIGGGWWNVYIGGPESGGHGWSPAVVREYARHGINHFMLTYVGRQEDGPLTAAQGKADAIDALKIANSYGYSGSFPLCLDVEIGTFNSAPSKTVAYTKAWCATVKSAGARPGVYANPAPLKAMAEGKVPAEFVWVASWLNHGPTPHDPHAIPQLPAELWGKPGQRAWQYAGEFDKRPCQVLGLDVDINVADVGCLASPPGGHQAQPGHRGRAASGARLLRRGSRGRAVQQLTRRLSFVPSRATGRPYLDGPRGSLGPEAEAALRAFQSEHRLDADGVYGPATQHALSRAIQLERARRQSGRKRAPAERQPTKTNDKPRKHGNDPARARRRGPPPRCGDRSRVAAPGGLRDISAAHGREGRRPPRPEHGRDHRDLAPHGADAPGPGGPRAARTRAGAPHSNGGADGCDQGAGRRHRLRG